MNFWQRNKTVITIQVDYDILFGNYIANNVDMPASRAEFLKLAKARIEQRYKAKVFAWGMDHGVQRQVTVEAQQSVPTIAAMEEECLNILIDVNNRREWVIYD